MEDPILPAEESAAYLHTPPATLQWWRHKGYGPRYMKVGRRVFYRKSWLDEFLTAAEVKPEAA